MRGHTLETCVATRCCQVARKYEGDYQKARFTRLRACRDLLRYHVYSQSGMKFSFLMNGRDIKYTLSVMFMSI